jgi:hypothetical protein
LIFAEPLSVSLIASSRFFMRRLISASGIGYSRHHTT